MIYKKEDYPNIPPSVLERANSDPVAHNKGRQSFDCEHFVSTFDAQARIILEQMIQENPGVPVFFPNNERPHMFFIPSGYIYQEHINE